MTSARGGLIVTLGALLVGACDLNEPHYFPAPMPIELTADAVPSAGTVEVTLPFRAPTVAETQGLAKESAELGFVAPWLRRDELALSVQYTVTNLADVPGVATVTLDGADELTDYDPAAVRAALTAAGVREQDQQVLSLVQKTPVVLAGGAQLRDTVREDEIAEAELDLDALGRWMGAPQSLLINASYASPLGLEMVPAKEIVPALFKVRLGLAATTAMRLEAVVRVRQTRERLASDGDPVFSPTPTVYTPPAMP